MSNVHGMVRSAYTFDSDAVSNETALDCGDESVTQQCFKDECDINILLAKFAVTGQLPDNVRVPQFVDFEETFDFQSSMNVIRAAEEAFNAMPAEVRDRFQNDPGRFLEFANDASNYDEALKMGLAIKRPEKAAVGPENGLPEPSVDLGAVRPGGADRGILPGVPSIPSTYILDVIVSDTIPQGCCLFSPGPRLGRFWSIYHASCFSWFC